MKTRKWRWHPLWLYVYVNRWALLSWDGRELRHGVHVCHAGEQYREAKTQAVHLLNPSGGIYKKCDAPMSSCHRASNLKDQYFHCFDTRSFLSIKTAGPALKGNQLWLWGMMNAAWPLKLNAFSLPWIIPPVFCSVEEHTVLLVSFTSMN